MTVVNNPMEPFTPFLPTTFNMPEEEERRKTFLVDQLCNFADVINDKKIGIYMQASETLNGEKWFYLTPSRTRNGYQSIAYIPSFPNATTLTLDILTPVPGVPLFPVPNINPQFIITNVWGSASRPCTSTGAGDGDYFSFYSEGNSKITFTMSDTQIIITTTVDMTAYKGFIVVQYVRDGV